MAKSSDVQNTVKILDTRSINSLMFLHIWDQFSNLSTKPDEYNNKPQKPQNLV